MTGGLNALQVAVMLVSASCGIGFLFGSGELALLWHMAGSLYAVATALGMLLLAAVAGRLWRSGAPIWDTFGTAYGAQARELVASLSVLWMCGVVAAQIHGGLAIVGLMGVPPALAQVLVPALIVAASRLDLSTASKVAAVGLCASTGVLLYARASVDGWWTYSTAAPTFVRDLALVPGPRLFIVVVAVAALVATGCDYQQFVIAARSRRSAVIGCLAAALILLVLGFLPASVVLAYTAEHGTASAQGSQIIPFIMARVCAGSGGGLQWLMLCSLLLAALGSGAAVTRAMTAVVSARLSPPAWLGQGWIAGAVAVVSAAVASRGQAIVETMVALNVVYLASVGVAFVAIACRVRLEPKLAREVMCSGLVASFAVYAAGWAGMLVHDADMLSLAAGLGASMLRVAVARWGRSRRSGVSSGSAGLEPGIAPLAP